MAWKHKVGVLGAVRLMRFGAPIVAALLVLPPSCTASVIAMLALAACSGQTTADDNKDSGQVEDAGETGVDVASDTTPGDGGQDSGMCAPGEQEHCELGRPCPGVAFCRPDGTGFGACGCVSCEWELEAGTCSWSLSDLGVGSVNPSFLLLRLEVGTVKEDVFFETSAADCGACGGWYLVGGNALELCPATCEQVNNGAEPSLTLGCGG